MSTSSAATFDVTPAPPPWLAPLQAGCHVLALAALALSALPWGLRLVLAAAVLASLLPGVLPPGLRPVRPARLRARGGAWQVWDEAGKPTTVAVPRSGFVCASLLIVPLDGGGARRWLCWGCAGSAAAAHRRLRTRLRLGHDA